MGVDPSDRLPKGSDVEGEAWLMSRSFPKFSFSSSFQVTGKADGVCGENILFNVPSAVMINAKHVSTPITWCSDRTFHVFELLGLTMQHSHASLNLKTKVNLG